MKRLILLLPILLIGIAPLHAAYDGIQTAESLHDTPSAVSASSAYEQALLNGRVYDPQIGRFLSPDPVIQFPEDLQNYNRYSYVRNNPLRTNDPTGYYEPIWLQADVLTLRTAKTPSESANLAAMKSTAFCEVAAGTADFGISALTTPVALFVSGSSMPVGQGTPMMTSGQASLMEASTDIGQDIVQGGRDLVTAVTGVADNNEGRNAMELSSNLVSMGATAAYGVSSGLARLGSNAIRTGSKSALSTTSLEGAVVERTTPGVANPRNLVSRQGPSEMTGNKIKRLANDMRKNGFDTSKPIDVANANGKQVIIDGHHRTEAAIRAGINEVPVNVTPVTPEEAAKLAEEAAEAAATRSLYQR